MSTTAIYEIAPDLFRLSIYVPDFDMQFNHFLVRDEEPLLFHAGLKGMFPALREAVAKIIDPAKLRHIAWSHFESDEIGGLNDWLRLAPQAQPVCTLVGKLVSVDDFSIRPALGMTPEDVLTTGKYRYRFYRSPHIPHGWDAGVLFEETRKTLFCSDLFHHFLPRQMRWSAHRPGGHDQGNLRPLTMLRSPAIFRSASPRNEPAVFQSGLDREIESRRSARCWTASHLRFQVWISVSPPDKMPCW
jgi:hypothetical protein